MWGSYRWGAPYGYQVYPGPVHIRESCLIGVKKLYFKTAPGYSYCREQAGGAEDSLELWTEAYDRAPDYVCLPNTQILSQTSFGCDLVNVLNEIKAVLNQYKSHLDNRVSTSTFYTNEDLTELNQVLSELNGGILLQTGDVQGDTNPPPMSNPWTQPMPCGYNLQIIEGTNNQEGLINQKL
ncbi:MAG: hypothetical protein HY746_10440, partial [Elusimicrobia bacterium]|nr:hypothetical protein [Elusimicrobiota bacterium]